MATIKKIENELKTVSTIGTIVSVYQEMAQAKMKEIRQEVLKTRQFLKEILKVSQLVKTSLKRDNSSFLKRKGEVAIVLTANEFFYGPLILEIWLEALRFWEKNHPDLVVIGRMGKYFAKSYNFEDKISYFELEDENPKKEKIKKIVDFIKNYKKIIVFHGEFKTILNQIPVITDISGEKTEEKPKERKKYLFEPSPEAVLEFFKSEIIATLFNQTLLEHRLARYAARTTAMYQANENAKKIKKRLEKAKRKLRWEVLEKKQMEIFSSFEIWKETKT